MDYGYIARREQAIWDIKQHPAATNGMFDFILGKWLGGGCYRQVFEYALDPKYVVKVDIGDRHHNILEYSIWDNVRHYEKAAKWLAPIKSIGPCGRVLIQAKCDTMFPDDDLPKMIPSWMTDIKRENFGMYKGSFVCFDYALNLLTSDAIVNNGKMKKAIWK